MHLPRTALPLSALMLVGSLASASAAAQVVLSGLVLAAAQPAR